MGERTEKPERGRLESGVVRAGVVAGAIAGIVGAVTAVRELLPDEPAKRSAEFANVSVRVGVPLSEYNVRASEGRFAASAGAPAVTLRLVVQETGAPESPVTPEEPEEPAPDDGTIEPPPTGTGEEPAPESEDDVLSEAPPVVEVTDEQAREEAPVILGTDAGATVAPDGSMEIEDPSTEHVVRSLALEAPRGAPGVPPPADERIDAREVVAIFKAIRSDGSEPLGATVDYEIGAVGFEGRRLDVRWTLYSADRRRRVPREWLRNRQDMLLEPDVGDERVSDDMWVPLPRARGPWFVRLSLFDHRGRRLTFADTKPFR